MINNKKCGYLAFAVILFSFTGVFAQPSKRPILPPGPMLDEGSVTLQAPDLKLTLLRSSETVASLNPVVSPQFDYTPGDLLKERSADSYYHLGDLDLRLRSSDETEWKDFSTAHQRMPVRVLSSGNTEFSADLAPTLRSDIPLSVVRTWSVRGGELVLHFQLTNRSDKPVHIGGLGIPMIFNNIMNGRTLEQAYAKCSFYDPYIGEDAGYLQVVPLTGTGPVLLVVPDGHTPFEAYKPILDHRSPDGKGLLLNDPTPRGITFEGFYDWMVHSAGFTEMEWKGVEEWNPGTEAVLQPSQSLGYGLRFLVAPSVREIETTLAAHHRPVAVGIPGYILPTDIEGRLFLRYNSAVRSITSEPSGAIAIHKDEESSKGWHFYTLRGEQWGRARVVITYADGTIQSIGYRAIKPETQAVADMGHFLFHEQWFDDPNDPFHRSPSVISYDDQAGTQVRQDPRVWIAGLSDEAGAGSWLAAAMKEFVEPNQAEIAKFESFVDGVLWGHLQESSGDGKYGVHKSLFYYQPDAMPAGYYNPKFDWKSWTSWNRKDAADLGRTYNYPHVVAAYWAMYRIARNNQGLVTHHPWQWYLDQAYQTTLAMRTHAPYYTRFGLMEGTVFLRLLEDLKREGWTEQATKLEDTMRQRAAIWRTEPYPFGSEMPWDSTGQEEVYDWTRYFGYNDKAEVTLNAILAYTPVVPSWGYNGSARRYWDFLYGGKFQRIERQLHHYGSGLNAIPLLAEYRSHPDDLYLLRAGYGGVMGPLANIDQKGFASAAFHSFPDKMAYDPYTGDYGPNFFGHALNTATYLTHDPALGWLCFGGNVEEKHGVVSFTTLDSLRRRVFIAAVGLWLTLDAGQFTSVDFDARHNTVRLHLAPANESVQTAPLRITQTGSGAGIARYEAPGDWKLERGAYLVPLKATETIVTLRGRK
ncbi:DUF5695 domain-containing protein [Alloacidobacterium sp.]|uniref:DUF5695 domain-containing protein n=1 Tax=Alloacidobacterium sp. TaxID=2951999 RepID=UPI002D575C75|nr:DUF5695 domain-containing protein [Alloacidobacterium sp.]HYK35747.1 DUF5695 domain-containing protein [Alloacidobacterium sp.]